MLPCYSCGFSNLANSRFCGGCGRLLGASVCPHCSAVNPQANRFCNQCGAVISGGSESCPSKALDGPASAAAPGPTLRAASPIRISLAFLSIPFASRAGTATARATALLSRRTTPMLVCGAVAVVLAQLGLSFSVEPNERAPIGYLLLLALGVASFALGSLGLWVKRTADEDVDSIGMLPPLHGLRILDSITGTIGLLIGVLALAALLIPLGAGAASGYMLWPWAVALAAFTAPFLPAPVSTGAMLRAWARKHYRDLLLVLSLTILFVALNLHDLQDWYYSVIGDEFIFYEHAKRMTEEGIAHPFGQEGVYNSHPVMSTVYQAAIMRVFGADYFGWTFSSLLAAGLSIPGIYLMGYALGGRKSAIVAAVLFSFGHTLFAFSHIGNNNLSSLPVAVWAMALFVLGWRKGNPLLLYAAGIVAGLGFYTHYSGRAMLPVMLLFALTSGRPGRMLSLWPLVFGFALAVAPAFVVEQGQVFTRMFSQVVGGYQETVAGDTGARILSNIEINLPAFNYNSTAHSYVYGPLLDPVSGALAALGIGFALGHIRLPSLRLLLIWFGVTVIATGVLSPYPHVAITRLVFVLAPVVLLAGVLAGRIGDAIQLRAGRVGRLSSATAGPALLLALTAAVLALNLWQFWHVTPSVFPHTPEAVALGAFRSEYCDSDANETVFVGRDIGEGGLLKQMLASFYPNGPLPRLLNHDEFSPDMELPGDTLRCVVFVSPGEPEARTLQGDLARRYPEGRVVAVANPSGTTTVEIYLTSQE